MSKVYFKDIVIGEEGLLKGPFGSDLKKSLYVPRSNSTYKVYLQENILKRDINVGKHYISDEYFNKKMKRYQVKEGDFIVTCDGTLGEIFQLKNIREKGIISSSLLRITLDPSKVDDVFFPYFWNNRIKYPLIRSHDNSVLKHLPGVKAIREFEFNLPDLPTQQKIAAVLSALDDKIELNNKINAELEAMAKTLYDYWFVQFEFPNAEGKPYKSSGGKMVYNETLKREIPEGWEVKRVEDVLDKNPTRPKINTKEYFSVGKYPIIDQSIELIAGYTNIDEYIISITIENPAIIFGDHTRILKLINFDFARGADGTQLLFSKESRMPQYLFYFTLLKIELVNYGYARHFKFLKDTPILIPTIEIGKNFNDYCKRIFEKKQNNLKQNQELATLRDWLLPMLMNGQVKVEEGIMYA